MSQTKYLIDANLLIPSVDKWAIQRSIITLNGSLLVLSTANNLSDLTNVKDAQRNLQLRPGVEIQPYSSVLSQYVSNGAPSPFALLILTKANQTEWRQTIGAGTVSSVSVSGGGTGLTVSGGPIIADGTLTIGGTLNVASGGTGVSSYSDLKTNLQLSNVDNTRDINKPVSTATQALIDAVNQAITDLKQRVSDIEKNGVGTGGGGNNIPTNALLSAIDNTPLTSAIDNSILTSAITQ